MEKNFVDLKQSADYSERVMESGDHSKNGASPKSLTSRIKFLRICIFLLCAGIFTPAKAQTWYIGSPDTLSVVAILNPTDSTLTISGTGAMQDYPWSEVPWYNNKQGIKTVIIQDGVTTIGSYTFDECFNLTSVNIPNSITTIGHAAFANCQNLPLITIPGSITTIDKNAFIGCYKLTTINVDAANMVYSSMME